MQVINFPKLHTYLYANGRTPTVGVPFEKLCSCKEYDQCDDKVSINRGVDEKNI